MIRYAELDENNNVINIVIATEAGILSVPGRFIKMDVQSNPLRKETSIGGTYNSARDMFVFPQPWPSWVLEEETLEWNSPVGNKPDDGKKYNWNEDSQNWEEIIPIEIDL
jgi:hypothetical protein